MKFNKLYLHGFKSFVDKTVVDFPDGITAIVGPNGSGKSNIMDAVRWVFGEQNARELRGADMEDIVFNGSQKRKPAGFAEVGLTLSDISEDIAAKYGTFSEITITRKFYKTGEREYYINNRKCRLKDIKNIFMDTGLGARSISIIEQGKVDKIINASPEELRFFLEETAGVTKFKDKKKEAERRLSQTRDNLDRLTDIIEEIVTHKQSLFFQVKKLKKYEEFQSTLKNLEQIYLSTSYYLKAEESNKIKELLIEKKKLLENLLSKYAELIKIEGVSNKEYNLKQEEYKNLQEKRIELATKKANIEGDIKALETKILSSDDIKANLNINIQEEKQRAEGLTEEIDKLTDELDIAKDGLTFIEDKLEEITSALNDIVSEKDNIEEEFYQVDSDYIECINIITSKENEFVGLSSTYSHINQDIAKLEKEGESINNSLKNIKTRESEYKKEIDNIQLKIALESKNLDIVKKEIEKLKREKEQEEDKIRLLNAEIKSYENNIAFYKKQLEAATSFNQETLELKPYTCGLLIDFLQDIPFHKLIDIGDTIVFNDENEDIIFKNVSQVKSSVKFVFKSDVENIKNYLLNMEIKEAYKNIYMHNYIYRKAGEEDKSFQIISLKENIKISEKEVEILNQKISEIEKVVLDITGKLDDNLKKEETLNITYNEIRNNYLKKEAEYNAIAQEYENQEKRYKTILKEIELSKNMLIENQGKIDKLKEDIENFKENQLSLEDKRQSLEEKLENIKDSLDEKKEEHTEIKIQYAQKEEQVGYIKKELSSKRDIFHSIKNNILKLEEKLEKLLNQDAKKWKEELDGLHDNLNNLSKEVIIVEEQVQSTSLKLEEIAGNIEEIKKSADGVNQEIKAYDDEVRKYELNLAGISSILSTHSAEYMEKYGKDIAQEYLTYAEKEKEPKKIKEEMNNITSNLDELGPINLNAYNDFQEAEDRYTFLANQKKDLEGSIEDIKTFIDETDEATVKIFQETFNSVKEKFVEVFHILFGNGEAELKLTEPDNLLISGVEIYIQPPGKKLQHMGLLSGGEKALTAMTLLFALFLQKPTPFCFLDEVDAPLDDANVERYVGMVKALSDKTQFILITHNHNTMSIADSIYGVAMQEYGVSTILSVTLEQVAKAGR